MTTELVRNPAEHGLGLPQVPSRLAPAATTRSVCGFCATGCSLHVHLDDEGKAINLSADPSYPVNLGMACPKGWEALTPLAAPDRATVPLLRDPRTKRLEPTTWNTALRVFAEKLQGIQAAHGPHSIAFLSTGQIPVEEMMFLGALFKFGMGALHCDSNTRQCMATSHVAYKQSFGFDAPPYTYKDFEESDVLVFVGSNPAIAHPIMWQRVMMNKNSPHIIVLDPPAFAKNKASVPKALSGYKEINLRALKLLAPGGFLVTCSCSSNVGEGTFADVIASAAADARVDVAVVEKRMQGRDHPVLMTVPETYYLKCFILRKLT